MSDGAPEKPRHFNGEPDSEVTKRGQDFLQWLSNREEKNIFVFAHKFILQELTGLDNFKNVGVVEMTLENNKLRLKEDAVIPASYIEGVSDSEIES